MLDRSTPPPFHQLEEITLIQAQTSYLDNNIPVHSIKAGIQPVIKVEMVFPAGTWYEKENGVAHFTGKMLREGTHNKTSGEISDIIESMGAHLELQTGFELSSVSFYSLNRYFEKLVSLIKELVTEPVFSPKELENLKNITSQGLKVKEQKNSYLASQKIREALFGFKHPYGQYLRQEDIEAINTEDLNVFYKSQYTSLPEIIISGDLKDNYRDILNRYLGHINFSSSKTKIHHHRSKPRDIFLYKESSSQSSIRLGKLIVTKNHPDYFQIKVLNELFGGFFGSRLMKNIREDKGYTYGIYSQLWALKHHGFMIIETDVKKEFTNHTIEEIIKEIRNLKKTKVPEQELETVKSYMLGSFIAELNTPFSFADKFKAIHFHGLDYDYYDKFFQSLKDIQPSDILKMANKYLHEDTFNQVIVGEK